MGSERRFESVIVMALIPIINAILIPIMFSPNSRNNISSKFKNKIVVISMKIDDDDKTNINNFFCKLKNLKSDNVYSFTLFFVKTHLLFP